MATEVTTVKQFYETDAAVTFEAKRLEEASPFELPVTMHHLKPLLFPGAKVLEVGVGCGHYTSELASLGCSIHIVDIADTFLDQTRKRLEGEGRGNSIIGSTNASGTNLSSFSSQSFDFVLLLGPLYHLCKLEERITCVQEATRVLKPGGYIVAGGVNKLAYFRCLLLGYGVDGNLTPKDVIVRKEWHNNEYLVNGNLDPEHYAPFWHLSEPEEFLDLFSSRNTFERTVFCGVESFSNTCPNQVLALTSEERKEFLELVIKTGTTTSGIGQSDHFLYIGKRIA